MTQRVDLSNLLDRLAIDSLITDYANIVDDGDWAAYPEIFTQDGRADYTSSGGEEGTAQEMAAWLEQTLQLFAMRQHLIVNRKIRFEALDGNAGDTATAQADMYNPMRMGDDGGPPDLECGARYAFTLRRTHVGWRISKLVVHEKWRRMKPPTREGLD
ncbi:nuclear transport factor 2 family protein [Streptomyces sp. YC504]|uniref:Nuclear transport factor 2 family protein n=1 Tax=Streptomyces mesophilus TaxID=1775132 RepID=A0A6G4XFK0_9ACTN|nr:nuclear transport factor 2 family protein [Streptomyces mesophilus]NGO75421.1 nuclear transport factor 2 family protein [Streptomyces mesophilus]